MHAGRVVFVRRGAGPGAAATYDVQRVDGPASGVSDQFGFNVINAGDLNADGVDDILTNQGPRVLNDGASAENGEVIVISGKDGSVIQTIAAPEPETASGTGLTENRSAAFGFYIGSIGRNASMGADFTDLSSCPGGNTDADPFCDAAVVGPPDGIPDIVASALFVDRPSAAAADGVAEDIGRVYVIDGATFTFVKRLDMPQADVDDLADETEGCRRLRRWRVRGRGSAARCSPRRASRRAPATWASACAPRLAVVAVPAATWMAPACPTSSSAPRRTSTRRRRARTPPATTRPRSTRASAPAALHVSRRAHRRHEPRPDPRDSAWNIVNPYAQADDPETRIVNQFELFGHSIAPIGDVGRAPPRRRRRLLPGRATSRHAGRPPGRARADFRVDYPTSGPDNEEDFDIGVNLVLDGETGAVSRPTATPTRPGIAVRLHGPEPAGGRQRRRDAEAPEIFVPAAGQDTDNYRGEGIGFLMNGARS